MQTQVRFRIPNNRYQEAIALVEAVNRELEGSARASFSEIIVDVEEYQVNGVIAAAREYGFPLIQGPKDKAA